MRLMFRSLFMLPIGYYKRWCNLSAEITGEGEKVRLANKATSRGWVIV